MNIIPIGKDVRSNLQGFTPSQFNSVLLAHSGPTSLVHLSVFFNHPSDHCYLSWWCCVLSHFSCAQLFAAQWTVANKAHLSMGFSRQEYWSGLPCPPPEDFPDPGIELTSLRSPALAGRLPLAPPKSSIHLPVDVQILHSTVCLSVFALLPHCLKTPRL